MKQIKDKLIGFMALQAAHEINHPRQAFIEEVGEILAKEVMYFCDTPEQAIEFASLVDITSALEIWKTQVCEVK